MKSTSLLRSVCSAAAGLRLRRLCSSPSVRSFSEKRSCGRGGRKSPGQEGRAEENEVSSKTHGATTLDRMKNCSGCDWMTDRDRRQGAEGSEAGLVESCLLEDKSVYWSYSMTNKQETSGFHRRGRDQKAGNPRMHTN